MLRIFKTWFGVAWEDINQPLEGLTVAELMVSLGVIGLISALGLPKVFSTFNGMENEAKMKEAVRTVQTLVQAASMEGNLYFSNYSTKGLESDMVAFVNSRLNAATYCEKGVLNTICNHTWANASGNEQSTSGGAGANGKGKGSENQAQQGSTPGEREITNGARWVMHDGTRLSIHESSNSSYLTFLVDVESGSGSRQGVAGADQLALICNTSEAPINFKNGKHIARPGECQPANEKHAVTYNALYGAE